MRINTFGLLLNNIVDLLTPFSVAKKAKKETSQRKGFGGQKT
jgi:hypothetical protein